MKSLAPVLAIVGQVPTEDMGSDFFQEVDNDVLFADVSVFCQTVTTLDQLPHLIERAGNAAIQEQGVAVLTLPGDIGGLDLPKHTAAPRFVDAAPVAEPAPQQVQAAADLINGGEAVALLVGQGARHARDEVLELAERPQSPMVLTLKAKDGFDHDNPYQIGQSGLIGSHATAVAFDACDVLVLLGTDFPYRDFLPTGKRVVQLEVRGHHIGRRTPVDAAVVGDAKAGLRALMPLIDPKPDHHHLDKARSAYESWRERQQELADPAYESKPKGLLRRTVDNPDRRIRPELVASTVDRLAAQDAIFTSDTGMATVWLSRFVSIGRDRRLIGSYNLGSMANAMPQALGASALDRGRQVIAFCGDGGLTMLLGELITAVTHDLPATFVVFDNGRLGMVKLEMEQVGLPEFGTILHNPDFAQVAQSCGLLGLRAERPDQVEAAIATALQHPGPALVDCVTNPDEIVVLPKPSLEQMRGFAIAKTREFIDSPE